MTTPHQALAIAARHFEADELDQAEAIYRQLLDLEPANAGLLRMLGLIARKRERLDEALSWLHQAVECGRDKPLNHFELGNAYIKAGRERDALPHLVRAVELDPNYGQACTNIGAILEHEERYEEAHPWCRRAVDLAPDCYIAHYNLGNVLRELGDLRGALASFERSIALHPEGAKAHWNSAFCHLALGDFEAGWREYQWRQAAGEVTIDTYSQPQWDGEPLAGRSIVVHAEQGIGDEILFASCFDDVIAAAGRTHIVCEPRLVGLFRRSFPRATVQGWQRVKTWAAAPLDEQFDFQIPAGSVPRFVRASSASFPRRAAYLLVDAARRTAWRDKLDRMGPGLKIGISWQAGGQPVERRRRTTTLDQWQDVLRTPGARFIDLQYGDVDQQLADARTRLGLDLSHFAECDPLVDMDDFAALVSALDLVISVGNATVHLAGAVGTPAWALLPLVPSWRWMSHAEQSIWYSSVRLIRQSRRGDWLPVFERVTRMLNELTTGGRSTYVRRSGIGFSAVGEVVTIGRASAAASHGAELSDSPRAVDAARTSAPATIGAPIDRQTASNITAAPMAPSEREAFDHVSKIPAVFDRAVAHYNAAEYSAAESLLKQILEHTPRHANALHLMGLVQRRSGRPQVAERSLRRALAVAPRDAQIRCHLADALKDLGRYDDAQTEYRAAIDDAPSYVEPYVHLGNLLARLGRGDEAVGCYKKAIEIDPSCVEAHNSLGAARLESGRAIEAAESFRTALAHKPDFYVAHNNLGRALLSLDKHDEALQSFCRAAEIAPDCVPVLTNLAAALEAVGQLDAAEKTLRLAERLAPSNAEIARLIAALDSQRKSLAARNASASAAHRRDAAVQQAMPTMHTRFVQDATGGGTLYIGAADADAT